MTADTQVKQSKWDEALDLLDEGVLRAACIFTSIKSLMVAKSSSRTNENITVCSSVIILADEDWCFLDVSERSNTHESE